MSGDITLQPTDSHEIHRSRALPTCPAQYQLGPLATGLARSLPAWPARYRLGPLATGLARSLPAWPARYRLGPLATGLARSLPAWPARHHLGPHAYRLGSHACDRAPITRAQFGRRSRRVNADRTTGERWRRGDSVPAASRGESSRIGVRRHDDRLALTGGRLAAAAPGGR